MVVSRDAVIYSGAFGQQNAADKVAMREDSIFQIASMTKPITSVAVMRLVEDGKVCLDDPVSNTNNRCSARPALHQYSWTRPGRISERIA